MFKVHVYGTFKSVYFAYAYIVSPTESSAKLTWLCFGPFTNMGFRGKCSYSKSYYNCCHYKWRFNKITYYNGYKVYILNVIPYIMFCYSSCLIFLWIFFFTLLSIIIIIVIYVYCIYECINFMINWIIVLSCQNK